MPLRERSSQPVRRTVLLLADRRGSSFHSHLLGAGYEVIESFSTDHAVAKCAGHRVDVAVLDQSCFIETDNWSIAQSIKAVNPRICVFLSIHHAHLLSKDLPKGVDDVVHSDNVQELLAKIDSLPSPVEHSSLFLASKNDGKPATAKKPIPLREWVKGNDSSD